MWFNFSLVHGEDRIDRLPQCLVRLMMFPQAGFEDRPLWFNGVQSRRVRGQIFQVTAFGFDKSLGGSGLREGRIVQ